MACHVARKGGQKKVVPLRHQLESIVSVACGEDGAGVSVGERVREVSFTSFELHAPWSSRLAALEHEQRRVTIAKQMRLATSTRPRPGIDQTLVVQQVLEGIFMVVNADGLVEREGRFGRMLENLDAKGKAKERWSQDVEM